MSSSYSAPVIGHSGSLITQGPSSGEIMRGAASADAKAYAHNLPRDGGDICCLRIEQAWGLEGYPPQIVSTTLSGIADGLDFGAALDAALNEMEGQP